MIDNRLGGAGQAGVLRETRPRAAAYALQVDRGDLSVSRQRTAFIDFGGNGHDEITIATPAIAIAAPPI